MLKFSLFVSLFWVLCTYTSLDLKEVKFWRGAMFVLIVLQRFMEKTTRINDIYQDYCVILLRHPHILNS
ncbi:hypothetical protein NQ317_009800 [Molorchus minor]|uniref:Secreted protein n=1 Tax=Molorchus minor TaxID=1323400 RepID=A0ABQ9JTF3_9CUCU|nr:hypothetical protein NQ317_009800 [Molorchus minor]